MTCAQADRGEAALTKTQREMSPDRTAVFESNVQSENVPAASELMYTAPPFRSAPPTRNPGKHGIGHMSGEERTRFYKCDSKGD